MEEADLLCDRIAIIDKGKIIALNTPTKLKNSLGGDSIVLKVDKIERAKSVFKKSKEVDGKIILSVRNAEKKISKIFEIARKNKIKILESHVHKPTLNDVFIQLTGREIREEKVTLKDQLKMRRRRHHR